VAIEFRCSSCGKLLRVGDENAGKQARCPACGTIGTIPEASPPSAEPAVPLPPAMSESRPRDEAFNAYQSPQGGGAALPPGRLEVGDVLGRTWEVFKARWSEVVVGAVVFVLLQALSSGIQNFTSRHVGGLVALAVLLAAAGFNAWIQAGLFRYMLRVARGEPVQVDVLFSAGDVVLIYFVASLALGFLIGVGLLLLIVPGIFVALTFGQAPYLVIDRGMPIGDAFATSRRIMMGNKMALFLLMLLIVAIGLVTCGVGLVLLSPYLMLLTAMVYLTVSGESAGNAM